MTLFSGSAAIAALSVFGFVLTKRIIASHGTYVRMDWWRGVCARLAEQYVGLSVACGSYCIDSIVIADVMCGLRVRDCVHSSLPHSLTKLFVCSHNQAYTHDDGSGRTKTPIPQIPQCPGIRAAVDAVAALPGLSDDDRKKRYESLVADPDLCPRKYRHPPAGFEFSIGCGMCAQDAAAAKAKVEAERAKVFKERANELVRTLDVSKSATAGVFTTLCTYGGTDKSFTPPEQNGFFEVKADALPVGQPVGSAFNNVQPAGPKLVEEQAKAAAAERVVAARAADVKGAEEKKPAPQPTDFVRIIIAVCGRVRDLL
jgi:hypothetical protein